jgi:hypothetical protein
MSRRASVPVLLDAITDRAIVVKVGTGNATAAPSQEL